ncbi:MAG: hypothetical protein ACK4MY_00990 [Brevundimonas sp.]
MKSTAAERQLSGALMAGAFALMCVALATLPSAYPNLTVLGRWLCGAATLVAAAAYLTSVFAGGLGWIGEGQPGPSDPFNIQAAAGLVGFAFHAVALIAIGFNGAEDATRSRIAALEATVADLKTEVALLKAKSAEIDATPEPAEVKVVCVVERPRTAPCYIK